MTERPELAELVVDIDQETKPTRLLEIFAELCEARALLWANYQIELPDAVDQLQTWAVDRGLVAAIGQDLVQDIMAEPFAFVRDESAADMSAGAQDYAPDDSWQQIGDTAADIVRRWELVDSRDR